jgi:predicted kinase
MARLILLNGPPGVGKSTLANRYVADHPLAFCLDIDGIRRLIGRWDEQVTESGLLARKMAVEMARVHLEGGHDVVVPQFLGRSDFIEQLQGVSAKAGAAFVEIALMDSRDGAIARFAARAQDPALTMHHLEADRMAGGAAGLAVMYDRLQEVIASRPHTIVIPTTDGESGRAYQDLLSVLDPSAVYDRQLLLFGAKRVSVLDLWEVQRYGIDSYGDADHVSIYGMNPADWHGRGIRLLGRTAVECTRDVLADAVAVEVAALAGSFPSTSQALVIDPFVGSGNTVYWIVRRLPGSRGLGFELDEVVCRLTKRNLAIIESPIEIVKVDYIAGLAGVTAASDELITVFVAPPWGDALDPVSGLDLRRTEPAVTAIVDVLAQRFPHNPLLLAIQVYERVDPVSLAEVESRLDWSALHIYELNGAGQNHGVLLGTRGWAPPGGPAQPSVTGSASTP